MQRTAGSNRTNVGLKLAQTLRCVQACVDSSNRTNVGLKPLATAALSWTLAALKSDQCGIETAAARVQPSAACKAQIGPMWD